MLTLEPLIEAVRAGVEGSGWTLSGLQKTTSHQFEGRWDGESTRSAYLFFHEPVRDDGPSIDVYVDETGQGLMGNLALVVDLVPLSDVGDVDDALRVLGGVASRSLPGTLATPVTLRLRMERGDQDPATADAEVRFKVRIPRRVIARGGPAVVELARTAVEGFRKILGSEELARYTPRS